MHFGKHFISVQHTKSPCVPIILVTGGRLTLSEFQQNGKLCTKVVGFQDEREAELRLRPAVESINATLCFVGHSTFHGWPEKPASTMSLRGNELRKKSRLGLIVGSAEGCEGVSKVLCDGIRAGIQEFSSVLSGVCGNQGRSRQAERDVAHDGVKKLLLRGGEQHGTLI